METQVGSLGEITSVTEHGCPVVINLGSQLFKIVRSWRESDNADMGCSMAS